VNNAEVWQAVNEEAQAGRAFCVAIISEAKGSVPRRAGSVMLVLHNGKTVGTVGGGTVERLVTEDALKAMNDGSPASQSYDLDDPKGEQTGSICGGSLTVLLLPETARMRMHMFGAGHVARPTAKLATTLGYAVTVYDNSDQWATRDNFPDAEKFVHGNLAEIAKELEWGEKDAVVILTGSHSEDFEILKAFKARSLPPYLGIIASKKKAIQFKNWLRDEGWEDGAIDHVHMPIGLDIHSRTPAEIAVSIMGEIIHERGPVE
jgi:xanthine dehydrogenase accessory factor